MKLEPVAWIDEFGNTFPLAAYNGGKAWRDSHKHNWKPLYAIPEGYVVVPGEQEKDAELLTWLIEKHGEQIRQIMWSYKQCCGDEINALGVKALITAAKEQS